ncbi:hypothetical protein SODG_005870 [Sodalis praecaptivus]
MLLRHPAGAVSGGEADTEVRKSQPVAPAYIERAIDRQADERLTSALAQREKEVGNLAALFVGDGGVVDEAVPQVADQAIVPIATAGEVAAKKPTVSATQTTAASGNAGGGRERELASARPEKADDAERHDSPPGISAEGKWWTWCNTKPGSQSRISGISRRCSAGKR